MTAEAVAIRRCPQSLVHIRFIHMFSLLLLELKSLFFTMSKGQFNIRLLIVTGQVGGYGLLMIIWMPAVFVCSLSRCIGWAFGWMAWQVTEHEHWQRKKRDVYFLMIRWSIKKKFTTHNHSSKVYLNSNSKTEILIKHYI